MNSRSKQIKEVSNIKIIEHLKRNYKHLIYTNISKHSFFNPQNSFYTTTGFCFRVLTGISHAKKYAVEMINLVSTRAKTQILFPTNFNYKSFQTFKNTLMQLVVSSNN